jgi:hypothetical protein
MSDRMTKSERSELGQLIRKRERVMKSFAAERAAVMMAEFDAQLATIYPFDQDEVWAKSTREAEKVVEDANKLIAERCKELGIPEEFSPSLSFGWCGRGENEVAGRRAELRRMAASKIKAIEAETVTKIERMSLVAQTEVISNGLESAAAQEFLNRLPSLESLMPTLNATELQQIAEEKHQSRRHRLLG